MRNVKLRVPRPSYSWWRRGRPELHHKCPQSQPGMSWPGMRPGFWDKLLKRCASTGWMRVGAWNSLIKAWSGRWESNPRPSPWQGDALPLSHFRSLRIGAVPTHAGASRRRCRRACRGPESNWRHLRFQRSALPTELPRRQINLISPECWCQGAAPTPQAGLASRKARAAAGFSTRILCMSSS